MTLSLRLGLARERVEIVRRRDPQALAAQLRGERYTAAYALAQLEPGAWERSEWWSCRTPQGEAVVCHSHAGLGEATSLFGAPEGIELILGLHPGPARTFVICEPRHLPALQKAHALSTCLQMTRMLATAETFRPAELETVRLSGEHVQALNRLYSSEGGPTRYAREHVDDGCYHGVLSEGRLVSVAGTHSISRAYGIAVLGNVFTHPQHRGLGYATAAASAVTADLLRKADEVVLSVDPLNTPAMRAYQRLGYREAAEIIEASASRRSGSVGSSLRRWLARRRAGNGGEVTLL